MGRQPQPSIPNSHANFTTLHGPSTSSHPFHAVCPCKVCEPADRETHMTCTRPTSASLAHASSFPSSFVSLSSHPSPCVFLPIPSPSLPHSPFDVIPSRSPLRQRLKTIAVNVTHLVLAPATRIRTVADDARADVIATRSEGSLPIASCPFVIAAPPCALDLQSEE
ncbi:hypothetical protein F5148DRAFT_1374672 [Russula earlei]|uniref:Uncharacterized protein n=1 Tax=Russula earlei TaxID=71964 RepID=A0ACC0UF52_9AGAM|nr:hypothetical protein F5148DRAFT_1374672 [Russula earlei]